MLRKIIAGVDGQPGSQDAAALASALAGTDADVVLAAVYGDPLTALPPVLRRDVHPGEEAEGMLRQVRDAAAPRARTHAVCDQFPARGLRHLAEQERADALVLGSTHRAPAGRAAAGRTGRQVLHDAPCPVAVAARGLAAHPLRLRRIVVGIDGSPESQAALALGAALGAGADRLDVVAVVDDRLPVTAGPLGGMLELAHWEQIVAERRGYAERLLQHVDGDACREVRVGNPAQELATVARDADLLLLGSRRWGPLERLVLGSTGEELLRGAPCSLLLVPRPAEVAEPRADAVLQEAR